MFSKLKRILLAFWQGGFSEVKGFLNVNNDFSNYQDWLSKESLLELKAPHDCKFSILMPVYKTPLSFLKAAIDSVINQNYSNWELCLVDDNSNDPKLDLLIEDYSRKDSRVRFVKLSESSHIAKTTNAAISLSMGDYCCFMDHDDLLSEDALSHIAAAVKAGAKLIYSDEDKINLAGNRFQPYFKPDFDPILLLSQNYLCHFLAVESKLLKSLNGLSSNHNGAQDWELILRLSKKVSSKEIYHINKFIYHWRVHQSSTANSLDSKPYAVESQVKAVQSYLDNFSDNVFEVYFDKVDAVPRYKFKTNFKLNILILAETDDQKNLRILTKYLKYKNIAYKIVCQADSKQLANYDLVLFLSNTVRIDNPNELINLLHAAMLPGVSCAGATRIENGQILAAAYDFDQTLIPFCKGLKFYERGYFNRLRLPHSVAWLDNNLLAVKAKLLNSNIDSSNFAKIALNLPGIKVLEPRLRFYAKSELYNPEHKLLESNYNKNLSDDRLFRLELN